MTPFSRRDTLRLGGGALASVAMPGCTGRPGSYPVGDVTGQLIDVHCHVFNGTDLPITTFLTRLALPSYDPKRCQLGPLSEIRSLGTIDDPDFIESAIELVVFLLLSATPTAREELAHLQKNQNGTAASDRARVRSLALDRLTDFLAERPSVQTSARANRMDRLRDTLWQEAGQTAKDLAARSTSARQAAQRLLTPPGKFDAIYNWTKLFFRSRQSLAQELVAASRSWGREPLMLVPLMVDYTHWLGQTTDFDSTLPDQVAVHGEIARRSAVPVHAMVAYDPLRAVFWKRGKHDRFKTPEFDPLDLARRAVTDHGCVGLKLYPPMGFRATGNSNRDADYPADVIKALRPGGTLGTELDQAMARAFDLCTELDVPILAHANNSLSAGPGYGKRAEPRFWIKALKTWPRLRLCLAHAGGFCWKDSAPPAGTPVSRSSWEWTIGRFIRDNPDSHLYMDISYFSEAFGSGIALDYTTKQLKAWITDCDPQARHILYGTDWTMLGKEPVFPTYGKTVVTFLQKGLGLTDAQLERVMWQNAMRYLGLDTGQTRDRLLKFYNGRRPAWTEISLPPDP